MEAFMTRFAAVVLGLFFGLITQSSLATNYSDWWADPSYGGSSMNISQQGNSLGLAWYFYDSSGTPTWIFGGGDLLSGTIANLRLFSARGVTLGVPASVTSTEIGSATISFTSDSEATFAFTYSGTSSSLPPSGLLSLRRYPLAPLPLAGTYRYAARTVHAACTLDPADNGTSIDFGTRVVTVASGNITATDTQTIGTACTFSGPYVQNGSKISVAATFTCSNGWSGNAHLDFGFTDDSFQQTGTAQVTVGDPCQMSMSATGVRE
jgi:hypothetical protein